MLLDGRTLRSPRINVGLFSLFFTPPACANGTKKIHHQSFRSFPPWDDCEMVWELKENTALREYHLKTEF